jgi:hypothetical protein
MNYGIYNNGILLCNKKEWTINMYDNMNVSQNNEAEWLK